MIFVDNKSNSVDVAAVTDNKSAAVSGESTMNIPSTISTNDADENCSENATTDDDKGNSDSEYVVVEQQDFSEVSECQGNDSQDRTKRVVKLKNKNKYEKLPAIVNSIVCDRELYQCKSCEKLFKFKSKLLQHEQSHEKEKPYGCLKCGKGYKFANSLRVHMLTHDNIRGFPCTLCSARLLTSSALHRHELTHSAKPQHHCARCGQSFTRKYNVVHHMSRCPRNVKCEK